MPSATAICMVPAMGTPATACREKQGASPSFSASPVASAASSISTPFRKKMRRQNRLWPRVYFSLQLKQRPRRRRSAISSGVRRRWLPSPRPCWAAARGARSVGGCRGAGRAGRGAGAGRRPRGDARGGGYTRWSSFISSTWRAKLMAAASVVGLWMRTAWLRGGRSPPVKSCTR
jgi:hypothetical protein